MQHWKNTRSRSRSIINAELVNCNIGKVQDWKNAKLEKHNWKNTQRVARLEECSSTSSDAMNQRMHALLAILSSFECNRFITIIPETVNKIVVMLVWYYLLPLYHLCTEHAHHEYYSCHQFRHTVVPLNERLLDLA